MDQILSSWKEIASFFGKGVRTVQRWEQSLGLPVRRPAGAAQNIVFARTDELNQWLEDASSGLTHADSIKTILVLENDEESRFLRRSLLEESGFIVFATGRVERAVEILKRGPRVNMLIADMGLITEDGAADQLLSVTSSVPVIGLGDTRDGETAEQNGWHLWERSDTSAALAVTVQNLLVAHEARMHSNLISFPNGKRSDGTTPTVYVGQQITEPSSGKYGT